MYTYIYTYMGFPGGSSGKEPACQCRRHRRCRFNPWVRKIPWRRAWQPIPVFLPGKSHGHRSLVSCAPEGHKESNTTEMIYYTAAVAAKSLQSCPTLCDPIDSSPPGSAILGILQARTLECIAISFSTAWKWKVKVNPLSRVRLLVTPWTAAHQAPRSMGFSSQEYWSGVPLPSPD